MEEFYDVRSKSKVSIAEDKCTKTTYVSAKTGRTSYAFKSVAPHGGKLTKFVSKEVYNNASIPVV